MFQCDIVLVYQGGLLCRRLWYATYLPRHTGRCEPGRNSMGGAPKLKFELSLMGLFVRPRVSGSALAALAKPFGGLNLKIERDNALDLGAAENYAKIVARPRQHGHPISVADAQIATIAASRQFIVATRDAAPFRTAGVPVIDPWTATIEKRP